MNKIKYFLLSILLFSFPFLFAQETEDPIEFTIELENAILNGCEVVTDIEGYSGTGYVGNFDRNAALEFTITIEKKGDYDLFLCYELDNASDRLVAFTINEKSGQGFECKINPGSFIESLPTRVNFTPGDYIIRMEGARNVVLNLDYIRVLEYQKPYVPPLVLNPDPTLVNPNSTKEAKELYDYFLSVYGKKIISGHCGGEWTWIAGTTGKMPKIVAFDFISHTCNPDLGVDDAIDWHNRGGIVAYQWHWRDPMTKCGNFYSYPEYHLPDNEDGTKFDAAKIFEPESEEYQAMMDDIDLIASKFKILQDKGIPVLWRPLHEATGNPWGGWFWWSTGGREKVIGSEPDFEVAAAACKEIYHVMYDRLVNQHGLNNLIWCWNTEGTEREAIWYPGDEVVDLVGTDIYGVPAQSPSTKLFNQIYAVHPNKMISIMECGTIPDPELLQEDQTTPWLYFCTWGSYIKDGKSNPWTVINAIYHDPYVIALERSDDIPPVDPPSDQPGFPSLPDAFEAEDSSVGKNGLSTVLNDFIYPSWHGRGYVSGFTNNTGELTYTITPHKAGEYDLYIGYQIPAGFGNKAIEVKINNSESFEVNFSTDNDTFLEAEPVRISLKDGANTIVMGKGWGYYSIDYIRIPGINGGTAIEKIDDTAIYKAWISNGSLTIYMPVPAIVKNIIIHSVAGQTIQSIHGSFASEKYEIPFATQVPGVYFIRINTINGSETIKVINK